MVSERCAFWVPSLLALTLVVAGCGAATPQPDPAAVTELPQTAAPEPDLQDSPLTQSSPLPTPNLFPAQTPTPSVRVEPTQLVVLHTNDNWGETEPCG
jgi:hypothetical protein